jgi:hypothetical protein
MGTLKLIGAIALGIFLCFFVLSTINAQRAEYAKRLGTFEGVPYSDLTSRAGNYQLIAYASLIVAIGSLAGACAFPGGKTCPRCGEIVKKKAVACRFCEYSFEESRPEQNRPTHLLHGARFVARSFSQNFLNVRSVDLVTVCLERRGLKFKMVRATSNGIRFIEPMYARLVQQLPEGPEWLYE